MVIKTLLTLITVLISFHANSLQTDLSLNTATSEAIAVSTVMTHSTVTAKQLLFSKRNRILRCNSKGTVRAGLKAGSLKFCRMAKHKKRGRVI